MEKKWEPFEVVEEEGRTILRLHGKKDQYARVEADKVFLILKAMANGWDIDIEYAVIDGHLDIREIESKLIVGGDGRRILDSKIKIENSRIKGGTTFRGTRFMQTVDFTLTDIDGRANFWGNTLFCGRAVFEATTFENNTDFGSAVFNFYANFREAKFKYTSFEGVDFICSFS